MSKDFKLPGGKAPNTVKGRFLKLEPAFFRHPKIETLRDLHGAQGNEAVFVLIALWAEMYNNSSGLVDMLDDIKWPHFREKILRVSQDKLNEYLKSYRALKLIDIDQELGPEKIYNSKIRAAINSFNEYYEMKQKIGRKAGLSTAKSKAKRGKKPAKKDVSNSNKNGTT